MSDRNCARNQGKPRKNYSNRENKTSETSTLKGYRDIRQYGVVQAGMKMRANSADLGAEINSNLDHQDPEGQVDCGLTPGARIQRIF